MTETSVTSAPFHIKVTGVFHSLALIEIKNGSSKSSLNPS
jgi:hypothetical protein